jgi:hypothetical protein
VHIKAFDITENLNMLFEKTFPELQTQHYEILVQNDDDDDDKYDSRWADSCDFLCVDCYRLLMLPI